MNAKKQRVLISAGEESGDLQGANLVTAMKAICPDIRFYGLGGKKMRQAGVETCSDIDRMGGLGLVEFIGGICHHWRVYRILRREIASGKYTAVILVHYPLFNLFLAKACRKANLPVFFFISPQIWAWRKGRIKAIRQVVSKMYVILPFEEKLYLDENVDVEFVGHPFVELVKPTLSREDAFREFGLVPGVKTIGLLPGSRKSEVDLLLDVMVDAAERIKKELGDCQFVLPVADTINPEYVRSKLLHAPVEIKVVTGKAYDAMNCSDYLICASGSVTLEAGLLGCPMVIVYKLKALSYWVYRWFVNVKNFGLVNIVAGEEVVPELLQFQVTAERIASEALSVLKKPERQQAIRARLFRVRESLGEPGVAHRLAKSIVEYLTRQKTHEKVSF
ncbi:MAG: lipid-A-disaccharide synthase [Nitrospinae bacterium RIFCSPLOWO2_12_FULL_47_7]|nr:MAG: lipid-A-disaccharide synthase [Nitrospinae bacterium RIFCSPLOWO2_12_FULL_47_7]